MSADAQTDAELQLSDYLSILRRRWLWVAGVVLATLAAATALTMVRGTRYQATAQVALGDSAAQEAIRSTSYNNVGAANRELSNEVNLAYSDAVTTEVVSQLAVEPSVVVAPDDTSDALRFEATALTPDEAALHANTWAQVYVDVKRRQASDSITEAVGAFQQDLANLRLERQDLRRPLDALEDQLALAQPEERAGIQVRVDRMANDLAVELNLLDTQIESVARNISSLELNGRLAATGTAQIVQVAAPPTNASSGSLARTLVLAAIVGLLAGAALALVIENLDRTIKTTDDLVAFGVPILGGVPGPGRTMPESELALATMRHTGTPVAEAYQKVRTAVEFARLGREINSLLITSPNQSEGKTTLSVNLAWAMSAVDHRVALVDVDFRRPRVHDVFDCPAEPGMSDNLLADIPLPQLALRVDEAGSRNLIVIPTGTRPPSPADFVASPAFTSLIRRIETEADLVIMDAPPVLPVSDAPSIGRQVDGVVMVVKSGSTTRDQLSEALADLEGAGAHLIGVVMVGLPPSARRYAKYGEDEPENGPVRPYDNGRSEDLIELDDLTAGVEERPRSQMGPMGARRPAPVGEPQLSQRVEPDPFNDFLAEPDHRR